MEIEYGPFQRRIQLAEDVDPSGARRRRYERGLLTVVLPLAPEAAAAGSASRSSLARQAS